MRRRGEGWRATGPCAIPGCAYRSDVDTLMSPPFVWDHCHEHDYVRGMLCRDHNQLIAPVEAQDHWRLLHMPRRVVIADLLAYLERCPHCAALGPWRPIMTWHPPGLVRRAAALEAQRQACRMAQERHEARVVAWREAALAEGARRRAAALKGVATRRARQAEDQRRAIRDDSRV